MADDLLKEIQENFRYAWDSWRPIREAGKIDMRYLAGDPWDPREKTIRIQYQRPVISFDEMGQYCNDLINNVRQSKRAVKVIPKGNGARDKVAEFRADLIRQIEYRSSAQAAYTTAFENAVNRSYGFARISKCYCDPDSFDQELKVSRIQNPDSVLLDPDYREADASDIKFAFIIDRMRKAEFSRRWPNAQALAFTTEYIEGLPQWVGDDSVQVCEYWKVTTKKRKLLLLNDGTPEGLKIYGDEIPGAKITKQQVVMPDGSVYEILKQRQTEDRKVMHYITNSVEILTEEEWQGSYIPLGACFGKELWLDEGAGAKRNLFSLVRLARDPQMLLNYYRACEMEIIGQVPKTPWVAYEGQLEGHEDEWQNAGRVPVTVLQAKALTTATGMAILPLPTRNIWEPPVQALEMGAEACRQAIRAAMGIGNLPTAAQRQNEKSGIALQKIQEAQFRGSFHFVDNYDRFLEHMGRMLNEQIRMNYDTPREVMARSDDQSYYLQKINQEYTDEKTGETDCVDIHEGDFDVTISVGQSYQSERDEANEFADTLVTPEVLGAAIAGNPKASKLASLAIKMKSGGPLMDAIADELNPEEQGSPEQAQQALAQAQQQLQVAQQVVQELQQKADANQATLMRAQMETQSREKIAVAEIGSKEKLEFAKIDSAGEIALADINSKEKIAMMNNRADLGQELVKQRGEDQRAVFDAQQGATREEASAERSQEVSRETRESDAAEREKDRKAARLTKTKE